MFIWFKNAAFYKVWRCACVAVRSGIDALQLKFAMEAIALAR